MDNRIVTRMLGMLIGLVGRSMRFLSPCLRAGLPCSRKAAPRASKRTLLLHETERAQRLGRFAVVKRRDYRLLVSSHQRDAVGRIHKLELRAQHLNFKRSTRYQSGVMQECSGELGIVRGYGNH